MSSTRNPGRFAGLLYLLGSIPGFFGLLYVPGKLTVHGDPTATAHNIAASETLFRLGIFADLAGQTIFIFVALALYHPLKGGNQRHALLMLVLLVVSIPISFLNELSSVAVAIRFANEVPSTVYAPLEKELMRTEPGRRAEHSREVGHTQSCSIS